jgi:1-deoxy-D-xylulose-5-phosphate reductoisomerase
MKNLVILGSTGSIGTQTLDVVRSFPNEFNIVGLTANKNTALLERQIEEFSPVAISVTAKEDADRLMANFGIEVFSGSKGLSEIAALPEATLVVNALVGSVGLIPTITAIRHRKDIALANKETLVIAGKLVMSLVKKNNVTLLPIDSEHSAILQCLDGKNPEEVKSIILTASGGPFHDFPKDQLKNVTVRQALNHPTWKMGNKITIDSATLMNKGFEVIEAHHLFDIPFEKIKTVIHPQSIIHSLVEFVDGSIISHLGPNDMRLPIQFALTYPKKVNSPFQRLDLCSTTLTFKKVDKDAFPCLKHAYEAGKTSGTMPAVLNASNEVAVDFFLKGRIGFMDIPNIIKAAMHNHKTIKNPRLDEIIEVDNSTKKKTLIRIDRNDFKVCE